MSDRLKIVLAVFSVIFSGVVIGTAVKDGTGLPAGMLLVVLGWMAAYYGMKFIHAEVALSDDDGESSLTIVGGMLFVLSGMLPASAWFISEKHASSDPWFLPVVGVIALSLMALSSWITYYRMKKRLRAAETG